ncbi:hypothetical protein MASSI9I_10238 [Massilia sp. 9I]|nr:hypothetical protein MASSI9I_10238 [Massilia sp. 9I]
MAVQASGTKAAPMRMGTLLSSVLPQMLAACWKAIRRCWPRVVPVLPPTGVAGVGSLKPSPGAFWLTMVMVAAAWTALAPASAKASAAATRHRDLMVFMAMLLGLGGWLGATLERTYGGALVVDALFGELAFTVAIDDRIHHVAFAQAY